MSTMIDLSTLTIDQILALQVEMKSRVEEAEAERRAHLGTLLTDAAVELITSGVAPTQAQSGSVYWSENSIPVVIDGQEYTCTVSVFDVEASKAGKARVKAEKEAEKAPAVKAEEAEKVPA